MARNGWKALSLKFERLLCPRRIYPDLRTGGGKQKTPRILAILPHGPDRLLLQAVSRDAGWTLTFSDTPRNSTENRTGPWAVAPAIILYDRELSPSHWHEAVGTWAKQSPRPYVILLSTNTDANLWNELQRVGGADIARTPLNRENMLSVVKRAVQLSYSQQQVRSA